MKEKFIAHRRECDGALQSLGEHLFNVSELAGRFASSLGMKEAGALLGLLHDTGKGSKAFANYIQSAVGLIDPDSDQYVDARKMKGKVDHSTAGAQYIHRELAPKGIAEMFASQMLALCIASHHSGLIDGLSPDGTDTYHRRMEKAEDLTNVNEAWSNLDEEVRRRAQTLLESSLPQDICSKLASLAESGDTNSTLRFKQGLLIRFLISCLVDADRTDTANFEYPESAPLRQYGRPPDWSSLINRLNKRIRLFRQESRVDAIRADISTECLKAAGRRPGLYRLTVPTGGGKTLASLRFALSHAEQHGMERIFYVIPYTSIIEQNAEEARRILEDQDERGQFRGNVVLEHHSNLTPERESTRQSLLSENWNAPVVFTTNVQLLEALFGSGTGSVRRMHQLANSVIIFDEIQTLPVRCVHMFNGALRFLVGSCGATVVLCTATQPLLDKVAPSERSLPLAPDSEIIAGQRSLFQSLKRVNVHDCRKVSGWANGEILVKTWEELRSSGSVLVVVNTKKAARALYEAAVQSAEARVFHLSTNMCPSHRADVLASVRKCLESRTPVVCFSTQLIEAGVDIDFGAVIRYLAGLDSIAQAAGRCNRHGRRQKGNVYIINPDGESLGGLPDIAKGVQVAERVLDEFSDDPSYFGNDLLGPVAMERYYQYYFYERSAEMSYSVGASSPVGRPDTLFGLLSSNEQSVGEYCRVNGGAAPPLLFRQSFHTAAEAFRAIDAPTQGIIVPYGDGAHIIEELQKKAKGGEVYSCLRKAQRFSVNVFPGPLEELKRTGAVTEVLPTSGVYCLNAQYYDPQLGLSDGLNPLIA